MTSNPPLLRNLSVTVCVHKKDIPPARLTANYTAPIAVLMSTPVYAHPALLLPLLIANSIWSRRGCDRGFVLWFRHGEYDG